METLKVNFQQKKDIKGVIQLNGSKSISNRVLIIKALSKSDFKIENLSNAQDTVTLNSILSNLTTEIDAGAGGTTYRFLTSFLCTQPGIYTLTGSERMKERPIKVLVDALNQLGAKIKYLEKDGFPPLQIDGANITGGKITMPGNISSQYLSSLLMIAPTLKGGLELAWEGTLVSRPYLSMTLNLMAAFGIEYQWNKNSIVVKEGKYIGKPFFVEGDWSAASYYYSIASLADYAEIELLGLQEESVQGDAVIAAMMTDLGVSTEFKSKNNSVFLRHSGNFINEFSYDFIECPDLAQTIVSMLSALRIPGKFKGLQTLKIKETDRIAALRVELSKFGADFIEVDDNNWELRFNTKDTIQNCPNIPTYEDHRVAMATTPLVIKFGEIIIEEPKVVNKSYPKFWQDLATLGFSFTKSV